MRGWVTLAIGVVFLLLSVYACRATERRGLFNNIVDGDAALRDHDAAWADVAKNPLRTRELLRLVRAHGGGCAPDSERSDQITCQVETSGRAAAMMPTSVAWTLVLARAGAGWRLAGRYRHEIAW